MQRSLGASSGCPKTEAFHYKFPETSIDGLTGSGDSDSVITMASENSLYRETSAPPYHNYSRPFYPHEFCVWHNFYPGGQNQLIQQGHWSNFRNHYYPMNRECSYPADNRFHCAPLKMFYHNSPHEFQFQDFHYFVVIDFEATCDKEKNPHPQEIIEFPSVVVNGVTGKIESSFQTYVRPSHHQHLTDFCKELTGIQQFQVDGGVPLSEALLMHDKWLENKGIKQTKFAVVTWSNWDCRVMLESECRFKRIRKPPYFNSWINLKIPFSEKFNGARCNLKDAVELAGLSWEGRPHCGLDDARNTARLLTDLMRRGTRFSITNSLIWGPPPQVIDFHTMDHASPSPMMTPVHLHAYVENCTAYCYCGLRSYRGTLHGRSYYGCGNWVAARRAACNYFVWAS